MTESLIVFFACLSGLIAIAAIWSMDRAMSKAFVQSQLWADRAMLKDDHYFDLRRLEIESRKRADEPLPPAPPVGQQFNPPGAIIGDGRI